jgi:hypothetical protein
MIGGGHQSNVTSIVSRLSYRVSGRPFSKISEIPIFARGFAAAMSFEHQYLLARSAARDHASDLLGRGAD